MAVKNVSFSWLHQTDRQQTGCTFHIQISKYRNKCAGFTMGISTGPLHWDNKNAVSSNMIINRNVTYLAESPNPFRFSLFFCLWLIIFFVFLVTIEYCTKLCGLSVLILVMTRSKNVLPAPCFSLSVRGFVVAASGTSSMRSIYKKKVKLYILC